MEATEGKIVTRLLSIAVLFGGAVLFIVAVFGTMFMIAHLIGWLLTKLLLLQ
jgi:hypothetical protein